MVIINLTRAKKIIAWVLSLVLASAGVSGAHHVVLHSGPFGAIILAIAVHPTDSKLLYLGSFGRGVFRSKDGGKVWITSNDGLENLQVQSLAIDPVTPTLLYAGTDAGVFTSANGGEQWALASKDLAERNIRALAIVPSNPARLYAGTDTGVFESTDGGGSWRAANEGLTAKDVRALAINPQDPQILYAATFGGVFKSTDGGDRWTATTQGLGNEKIRTLILHPQRPSTLYAGAATRGVFVSEDGGASWRPATQGMGDLSVMTLAILPSSSTIYAGTTAGLLQSNNSDSTWEQVEPDSFSLSITALATDLRTPQTLYVGTGGLFFKSVDGGENWSGVQWVIHPDLRFEEVVKK